jgi:hypothetical protein
MNTYTFNVYLYNSLRMFMHLIVYLHKKMK